MKSVWYGREQSESYIRVLGDLPGDLSQGLELSYLINQCIPDF